MFEFKCRLNKNVCNSKQISNHNECWCECKELDDWSFCKGYMWNPDTCDCKCEKACKIAEYFLILKVVQVNNVYFGKLILAWY